MDEWNWFETECSREVNTLDYDRNEHYPVRSRKVSDSIFDPHRLSDHVF